VGLGGVWGVQEYTTPLEPLLKRLSEEFIDDEDLSARLHRLFKVDLQCWGGSRFARSPRRLPPAHAPDFCPWRSSHANTISTRKKVHPFSWQPKLNNIARLDTWKQVDWKNFSSSFFKPGNSHIVHKILNRGSSRLQVTVWFIRLTTPLPRM
jgi:hypothetical protein